ncbi:hypothetical protein C2S52_012110 [Perilla frutescens var. hirtella]|nr:hypothetical protein C2S52_012110 [Perilla frutescens var. hirtella]
MGEWEKEIFEDHAAVAQRLTATLSEKFEKVIEEMSHGKTLTAPTTLVIQKRLFGTDLSPNNNRYMKKKKKKYVIVKKKRHVEVKIIEPSLELETVKFCRWDMAKRNGGRTSSSYIINGKWSPIMTKNSLWKEIEVQLWCFRVDQDLCFGLVPFPQNHHG